MAAPLAKIPTSNFSSVRPDPQKQRRLVVCGAGDVQRKIVEQMISNSGFDVLFTDSGEETLRLVADECIEIVITSAELKDMSGHELCWHLKARPEDSNIEASNIYVILTTSDRAAAQYAAALDAGADDTMRKPFEPTEMQARLRVARRTLDMMKRMHDLATIDPLTSLLNRRAFNDALLAETKRAIRHKQPLSLVSFDIDHFKSINDGFGHAVGDTVLQGFATVLRNTSRTEDIPARLGGEEFVILLPMTRLSDATTFAESLRRRLEATPLIPDDKDRAVTASFGTAGLEQVLGQHNEAPAAIQAMLTGADHAAYRAKAAGRNQVIQAELFDFLPKT